MLYSSLKMNLLKRVFTALVLGPVLLVAMWAFNPFGFYLVAFIAMLIGLHEFASITLPKEGHQVHRIALFVLGTGISILEFLRFYQERTQGHSWLPPSSLVVGLAVVLLSLVFLLVPVDLATGPQRLSLAGFGLVYCGLLFTFVAAVGLLRAGPAWVTMLLTISWLNDTGGYFAGRFLGGKIFSKKLYAEVSPKKTWEGFFGGLVGSFVATLIAKFWYFPLGYAYANFGEASGPNLELIDCVLLAIPAGAIGVAGDLVESMFKRAFDVKDSGAILPGHGGMLDRVDALLFAAPYVYLYGYYFFDKVGVGS